MTADEYWVFCQRPENADRRTELVRGEVAELPRPTRRHSVVVTRVSYLLDSYSRQHRVGYVAIGAGVVLADNPGTVVGPDVGYFTDAETFADLPAKWDGVPPVLAVEVLLPDDKRKLVAQKIADYLDAGVKVLWVVDYEERYVTVYRANQTFRVVDEDAELTAPELPGFACKVADFFRLPGDCRPTPPVSPPPSA